MGAVIGKCTYGLLVVSDRDSADAHDDWNPATEVVHAGPDSLYVGVRDAAGGAVLVIVADRAEISSEAFLLHEGSFTSPSLSIHVYDPGESFSLVIPIDEAEFSVKVYGDNLRESSEIVVLLGGSV
ncbi:hypothetical protein [Saccharothrix syringae]|nr:hypothetical protein [Saccharothrix syringae]